jgi:hypothetical protein
MNKLVTLAGLAFAGIIVSTSFASAMVIPTWPPMPQPNTTHSTLDLECRVKNNDFYIINFGNAVVDSGRQIEWRSPTTNDDGRILLPRMLNPGDEVKLADVLTDVALSGAPCTAAFV